LIPAVLLVSLLLAAPAAEPGPGSVEQRPVIVRSIEVEGNQRTSAAYVRSLLGIEPGQALDLSAVPALEQRLLQRGIFRSVRISPHLGAAGTILRIDIREKVTLVPIPILAASRGGLTSGAAVLDSDFLGAGKQLAGGVLTSIRGATGFAAYRDPSIAFTRWTTALRARLFDLREEQYDGDTLAYRFRDRRLELGFSGGYRLDDRWSVEAGWVERRDEGLGESGWARPPRGGAVHGPGLALDLDATEADYYLARGVAGRLELRQGLPLAPRDRDPFQAWSTVTWSGRAWRDHGVFLQVSLDVVGGDPVLDAVRLGGAIGSRGLRSEGLWAQDAARAALEYQVPFWRPGWGVLTAAAFCDAGAVRWRGRGTEYVAPGVGLRAFLRNVAVPVVGVDLAWASGQRVPAPSVQLGFRY
jgi:outer membrane protein assembly factor BamA